MGRYLFPKSPAVIYVAEDSTLQDSLKEETKEKAAAVVPEKDTAKVVSQVKEKPDTVAAEKSKQSEYEAKYAEIRYGAYNIEGVDQTVTVRKGQTLASISRSYTGRNRSRTGTSRPSGSRRSRRCPGRGECIADSARTRRWPGKCGEIR